ncbi:Ubiquitin-conjugating enzyme/RWD-like protein [Pseudocohnilembus persalinus]|uniref:Ubiquitin-conjugating enzyme/RWD-like protein n=1 Tax=Pseudocohnilembus persalinus TaxID=266149 RepID=A0A0V0R815_PSEPJ|nr:Ubiquitin-conjugating enzyme/RWD-like protein [Pseudocohnilembus persalinus]|eukprot:KRX10328.1 Ubiquitin-conjugating enzyme/RWD-like protein [Pseudocohnilembus persalinus]
MNFFNIVDKVLQASAKLIQYNQLLPELTKYHDGIKEVFHLELIGHIPVTYKGNQYQVKLHVQYPDLFPTVPPVLKIANINPNIYTPNKVYTNQYNQREHKIKMQLSQEDFSLWQQQFDPSRLIQSIQMKLSTNFPFFLKKQDSGNLQFQSQMIRYTDQQFINLQQKVKNDATKLLQQIDKDIREQKNSMDQVYSHKMILDEKQATLNITEQDLNLRVSEIEKELQNLQDFIQNNDHKTLNEDTLNQIMKPQDDLSNQIIELTSNLEAYDDTLQYIEDGFKEDKISFDEMVKQIRYYSEQEFMAKVELKKCENYAKHHPL